MSDKMRWRYGDTNPVVAAVDARTVIEIGDLRVAGHRRRQAGLGPGRPGQRRRPTRSCSPDKFLGVAMQRSRAGDTAPIRVATTGVFEFDCPSGTFELGDLVGADENAAGNALLNQQVAKVGGSRLRDRPRRPRGPPRPPPACWSTSARP